jgi:DNA mismatch endonuclease, patch repair protein
MLANKGRNTAPEMAVRSALHKSGFRYRVDYSPLGNRRRADIVFTRLKVAVFIDGCFWHGCPLHATFPATNVDYWEPKLRRNRERDDETNDELRRAGWIVLRFWEHEDPEAIAQVIGRLILSRQELARSGP